MPNKIILDKDELIEKYINEGLSQKKVADDLKITKSSLAMYERDKRIPRDEIKVRIADYFGETVQSIFYTN